MPRRSAEPLRARRRSRRVVLLIVALCASMAAVLVSGISPAAAFVPPPNDYVAYNPYYRTGNVEMTAHFSQYGTNWTCKFKDNSPGMVDQSGDLAGYSCAAQNITDGNYGYTSNVYRYADIYYGAWYSGAWACIYPGYYWEMGGIFTWKTNYGQLTFNHGQTVSGALQGYGQSIWYNVRSLQWARSC